MNHPAFYTTESWQSLKNQAACFDTGEYHLRVLLNDHNRFDRFSIKLEDFFFDFSKQRMDESVFQNLCRMARELDLPARFTSMASGGSVNRTEKRAALHTAARDFSDRYITTGSMDVKKEVQKVNRKIRAFTEDVHNGRITGSTGKRFTDVVVVGIGGSYLGASFVNTALGYGHKRKMGLHFLSNVDIDNFAAVIKNVDVETTLFVVISKSYTTVETMANLNQIIEHLQACSIDPEHHLVTVTSRESPGDDPSNPVLGTFHMFDFIGGRYSVTSAVGGVPLSLAFGFDVFEEFLRGAHQMDLTAETAEIEENPAVVAALVNVWNSNGLGYNALGIIPYSTALSELPAHIQQLYMESLGKAVTAEKNPVSYKTGVLLFGEPGTNAQHSFFQLAHQGMAFPIEFIGAVKPGFTGEQELSGGVTNHQELWANMVSQARALAVGRENPEDLSRHFTGNRPSSTIVIPDLQAFHIGMLLSFYEARTVYEGFILDINPFDQFGVELGKKLAGTIRKEMAQKNANPAHSFHNLDEATRFYLEILLTGEL
ncbi:MAG: glucose-6-phosphate isomerase [Desulfarculaceae bacterium]|nr:glucose-6-phosphate isomerase [Desulfarculaceae bacterium]